MKYGNPEKIKERLKKIARKKMSTIMIYPLSQFEQEFGELWGHGKPESELTSEEKVQREKWNEIRKNILDAGNHQIRNLFVEIDLHDLMYKGYEYTMAPRDNKE